MDKEIKRDEYLCLYYTDENFKPTNLPPFDSCFTDKHLAEGFLNNNHDV